MPQPLKVAVAGVGRMGPIHALHVHELAKDTGTCVLAALVDRDVERARRWAAEHGSDAMVFGSVDELAHSGAAEATVIVTPTENHRQHAARLIASGQRILLEKPLTGTLEGDREFAAELDRDHPNALMLAFQRRFDPPLHYAKELMDSGIIGRVFKVYSALEDSNPAPNGYKSGGILPDMAVHNVDEILWLTGRVPRSGLVIGSRIHTHKLTTAEEDFDDALMILHFEEEMMAQVQVSRNHVSGYRVETIIFGEEGQIHVGHFDQKLFDITVEAYGRRGRSEPLAHRMFPMRNYGQPLPEFVDRFGFAYKAELSQFIDCCNSGAPFPTSHRDGVRAQEVIAAAMRAVINVDQAAAVHSA
ncbi:MAG TPA: Gfo/Idh/MocA family oxidoreductase [Bryobacteraceae bacterium]|nr:Gfo/Idh/MocA family oxidoreductase [Bryobacteraceae bacterium]